MREGTMELDEAQVHKEIYLNMDVMREGEEGRHPSFICNLM